MPLSADNRRLYQVLWVAMKTLSDQLPDNESLKKSIDKTQQIRIFCVSLYIEIYNTLYRIRSTCQIAKNTMNIIKMSHTTLNY